MWPATETQSAPRGPGVDQQHQPLNLGADWIQAPAGILFQQFAASALDTHDTFTLWCCQHSSFPILSS